jgi:molybdopterin-guanine dinucleotide biosynthesis protein A
LNLPIMTLTAALFVGGESRRMGVDKATLLWRGQPLWARQLECLRELKPDALWISARTRPSWCPAEIEVVTDEQPGRGPLSGISAVLGRLQTTHCLALAIDLPRMTSDHLRKLRGLMQSGCGVIPANGKSFEPLGAIYPIEAAATAREALAGHDISLHHLAKILIQQKRLRPYELTQEETPLYQNINTRVEFEASGAET